MESNLQKFIEKHSNTFKRIYFMESDTNVLFEGIISFKKEDIYSRSVSKLCNLYPEEAKKLKLEY